MPDINPQLTSKGFGAYLQGILPDDIALSAGSFSAAMQQVKNLKNNSIEKVATVAYNIETMKNLNINGTNVPVDIPLAYKGLNLLAKGDGPYMTYTMSNFFGAMSGLPYNGPFKVIYDGIKAIATPWLFRIYQQNYLAITWRTALGTVQYSIYNVMVQAYEPGNPTAKPPRPPKPRIDDWYYNITGITLTDKGGGYGRERTAYTGPYEPSGSYGPEPSLNPNVTIFDHYSPGSGATAICSINFDDKNVPGDFGRVISLTLTNPGSPVKFGTTSVLSPSAPPPPTLKPPEVRFQTPPTDIVPPYTYAEYKPWGTSGWPVMNNVIKDYVDRANTEIKKILSNNGVIAEQMNTAYNQIGSSLTYEQQARSIGLESLPYLSNTNPRDTEFSNYPLSILTFTDSIPNYAEYTQPHMYAQTLEAISNWNAVGGRSIVGLSRESRNKNRLNYIGISLDNNIPDTLTRNEDTELIFNGTLPLNDFLSTPPAVLAIQGPGAPEIVQPPPVIDGLVRTPPPPYFYSDPIPGNLSPNPYLPLFPLPVYNVQFTQNTLSSGIYNVQEAIDQVILCNCDCWNDL